MKKSISYDSLCSLAAQLELEGPGAISQLEQALHVVQVLDYHVATEGPEAIVAFGEFGLVVRMTHLFAQVSRAFNVRRRRGVTKEIRTCIQDIAVWAILFLTLQKGGDK